MSLITLGVVAVLFAAGTYLILQRMLSRVVIGLGLVSHGANLLIFLMGRLTPGQAPLIPVGATQPVEPFADPLPQALVLTAIVISFGVTAFLLALALRSYLLTGSDAVEDDLEDLRIRGIESDEKGASA